MGLLPPIWRLTEAPSLHPLHLLPDQPRPPPPAPLRRDRPSDRRVWVWRQMIEATPWGQHPKYLIHDRDRVYGADFATRIARLAKLRKKEAPMMPVAPSISATPETSERTRQTVGVTRGSATWRSRTPKAANRPTERTSGTSARADPQPARPQPRSRRRAAAGRRLGSRHRPRRATPADHRHRYRLPHHRRRGR